ncbi:MAG: hypothetical protein GX815_12355, partial [Clostridiales bacterium]|nr:hypothetical protein [Clostridiales bacterium]
MKRNINIVLALLLSITMVACQKTPDSPIVKGKNLDNIVDKAIDSPIVADPDSGEDLRQPLQAPDKLILETEGVTGNLKISVDADVIVPNTPSMPVARVTKGQYSEDDVKKLYEVLHGDGKPIHPDSPPSSGYYLDQIQYWQEKKASGYDDDKLSAEGIEIDDIINDLMEQAANAPDSYEEVEPDFSFRQNTDENKGPIGLYTQLKFMRDDNTISEINVIQDSYGSGAYAEYIRDNMKNQETNMITTNYLHVDQSVLPDMKQDDAKKLAQDTITKLGLSKFACTGARIVSTSSRTLDEPSDQGESMYEFMFTRKINEVPITYTNDEGLTTVHDAYFQPWMYETIRIFIDDKGVFYMKWSSPYDVKEIVSDSSTMLPFSDIKDVFKEMTPIIYDHWDQDEMYLYEMKVTEARLALMRVTEQDVGDSGLV